ncbi:MAG: hypothetical protein U1D67_07475, partial [Dehalococcoidia bacterium]|nr:hypothetical protein [Dehalococcoidia bacterium]
GWVLIAYNDSTVFSHPGSHRPNYHPGGHRRPCLGANITRVVTGVPACAATCRPPGLVGRQ